MAQLEFRAAGFLTFDILFSLFFQKTVDSPNGWTSHNESEIHVVQNQAENHQDAHRCRADLLRVLAPH